MKRIPTPFDQKKHLTSHTNPPILKLALYHDFLLVQQDESIYYSHKNRIDWKLLPSYNAFFTDPESSALFFRVRNGLLV
ncbi:MAG: hypothetical protein J7578_08465, partial [Chitinophagaceae bacterium]|nr:hypothetical protein [Chitinophagaceae bacterium]